MRFIVIAMLCSSCCKPALSQTVWTDKSATLSWLKLSNQRPLTETRIDRYVAVSRGNESERPESNEFQRHRERLRAKKVIQNSIDEFNVNDEFIIRTSVKLKEYDFERNGFPTIEGHRNREWSGSRDPLWSGMLPSNKIYFANWELLNLLPMEPNAAEDFLAERRRRDGQINRVVTTEIVFRVYVAKLGQVRGDIQSVVFFDDDERSGVLCKITKHPERESVRDEAGALLRAAAAQRAENSKDD